MRCYVCIEMHNLLVNEVNNDATQSLATLTGEESVFVVLWSHPTKNNALNKSNGLIKRDNVQYFFFSHNQ